jgi:CheY-like chemotaxis protein
LTASVFESERASVIASGCDDFVRKPFREEEIAACLVKHLGVAMVYADDAPPASPATQPPSLDLTGLPAGWVVQVRRAATAADAAQLLLLAAEIEEIQPALAVALAAWVEEFDYEAIVSAVASTGRRGSKSS